MSASLIPLYPGNSPIAFFFDQGRRERERDPKISPIRTRYTRDTHERRNERRGGGGRGHDVRPSNMLSSEPQLSRGNAPRERRIIRRGHDRVRAISRANRRCAALRCDYVSADKRGRERDRETERAREREREREREAGESIRARRTNRALEKAGRRKLRNVANREFRDVPWSHVASLTATFSLLLARESQSPRVGDPGPATNTFLRKLEMDR